MLSGLLAMKKDGVGVLTISRSIGAYEDALEGLAEFHIEDGVDDGVDERIDVTQPRRQVEGDDTRLAVAFEFRANGVQNVAREERNPANQEDTCQTIDFDFYSYDSINLREIRLKKSAWIVFIRFVAELESKS